MVLLRACAIVMVAGLLAGCGEDGGGGTTSYGTGDRPSTSGSPSATPSEATTGAEPTTATGTARTGTELEVRDSEFGPMLFDGRGQAIYLFDVETSARARCYDDCAVAWPPVTTEGEPVAGTGVDQALLGSTERRDGTLQVTYGGHPLYFYAHEAPGEVKCHDVFLNGGNWYVVRPDGTPAPPG